MENNQETSQAPQIDPADITLDNLREGKFTIKDIPRPEAARLWREEYQGLEDGAKEVADAVGWKPKHFFLGKNRDGTERPYKDWKEFDKDSKEIMPILNERLKNVTKEKLEANAEVERLRAQIESMTKLQRMQAEREIRKDKSSVDSEMQEAFDAGDRKRYVEAQERKAQIENEEKILKEFEPRQAVVPPLHPEVILFKANNPWFEKDKKMTHYARSIEGEIAVKYPRASLAQILQMVEDDVKTEFAENFKSEEEAPRTPAVESGRNSGRLNLNQGEISFDRIPAEEQIRAERMIKLGHFKSKAEFVKEYNQKHKK